MTGPGFPAAVAVVLLLEGKDADHTWDPGGRTRYGITAETWARWLAFTGQDPATPIETIDPELAATIYRALYWTVGRCDRLDWPLSLVHFDSMVQHSRAPQLLQEVLGVTVDGILGPATLAAAASSSAVELTRALLWRRLRYYRALLLGNHKLRPAAAGWIGRMADLREFALGLRPLPDFTPARTAPRVVTAPQL